MGFIDRLRRRSLVPDDEFSPMPGFRIEFGDVTRFITDSQTLALMREGQAQRSAQEQFLVLDMLTEQGRAEHTDDGFAAPAPEVARLDDADAAALGLPPRFSGDVLASVHRWTAAPDFRVDVLLKGDGHPEAPQRRGPVVRVDGATYRTSLPLLRTLNALEEHAREVEAGWSEIANVRLVAHLQEARELAEHADDPADRDPKLRFTLGSLDRFTTIRPTSVSITATPQPDGSLTIEPDLGPSVDRDQVASRWHHLNKPDGQPGSPQDRSETGGGILRADETFVLLDPRQVTAIREVQRRPRIAAEDVATFLKAPGDFYDPALVDVDIRFSVRVAGLGVIAPLSFNEAATSGLDWFSELGTVSPPEVLAGVGASPVEVEDIERTVTEAWSRGDSHVAVEEQLVDVADHSRVERALAASRERVASLAAAHDLDAVGSTPDDDAVDPPEGEGPQVTVGMHIRDASHMAAALRDRAEQAVAAAVPVDDENLALTPFPHQREGIEWMTGLMSSALTAAPADPTRVQGALLADDMGLGKTFMTLVALAEVDRLQRSTGATRLPTLAVMPAALLENWLREIEKTFGTPEGPFDDIVPLRGTGVSDYRIRGAGRETAAAVDDLDVHGMVRPDRIKASLRIGEAWKDARLDRPGVLVLTTYETLRRYQVSLGAVEWGVVVFDEAQNIKNPETLASRAAKGLQARFKLLATGTPVENSLRDFWSLLDTAQPGLLGTWKQFQEAWDSPMKAARGDEHQRLGRALRNAVGSFMLRRVKEDHLVDLPAKHLHEYRTLMPPVQQHAYDAVMTEHHGRKGEKGAALATLHGLAAVSLHPGLLTHLDGDSSRIADSARTLVTVETILDGIRSRGEKAIVFAKRKELQRVLALWLGERYGLRVDVVNGDTAASGVGRESRMGRIAAFEARPGFNVIIMSPLAAGVGLTVVGANHAIHLERHWNPAKEAQATDRIYRIGQTREVHVHYPIALHPSVDSFDVNLERLLRTKVALKDAVVVPQEVEQAELESALGLL